MGKKDNAPLSAEEERVIIHKGTEAPFTGKYWDHFERGIYHCRRCEAPLYRSETKFESHCGWPSFDDEIPGAVTRRPDADGVRTEIVCSSCGGHLGHVFTGEKMTEKDTRHCVNSVSLKFVPEASGDVAVVAGGCFWGVEELMRKAKGVIKTRVGYTGGEVAEPSYEEVCSGRTGHYEAVEITWDPSQTSYEKILELFFCIHDFTCPDGQGPDRGPQYRSAIFYTSETQREIAETLIRRLQQKGYSVVTPLIPFSRFWPAEDYHQHYYAKNGGTPYCHAFRPVFT